MKLLTTIPMLVAAALPAARSHAAELRAVHATNTIASLKVPKRLSHDTPIVQGGQARAIVLHPDSPAGREAAAEIARAVHDRTGVTLECRPATAADREPGQNAFLLGSVDSNPAMLPLYGRFLTSVDAICPGPQGTLVHTTFDPFGKQADVIVVGASDDTGLRKAGAVAADAIRKQKAGRDLVLPRLFLPKYSAEFLKRCPIAGRAPEETRVAEGLKAAQKAIDEGMHCSVAAILRDVGVHYRLTENSREAKLYVALWDLYARSAVANPRQYGGPWGFDSDFPSGEVVAAWDIIEHDPALSDDDRLQVTQHMARWLTEAVIPKCAGAVKSTKVVFNHQTFPALGALFAGLYFSKGYDSAEGPTWLRMADAIFRRQATSCKPYEDCNTYQWLTNGHLMRYSVARPDFTVIENGNARQIVDFCLGNMDNLGYEVPYGDTGSWKNSGEEIFSLSVFGHLTRDPDALWAIDFKEHLADRWSLNWLSWFHPTSTGAKPTRFNGVKTWPLEAQYYNTFLATSRPPLERCFDKISFREAMDPQAAYLLLDGLNNGGHGHRDGNSVTQLTQYDRIWLADNDYFKTAVKFHNSLLIFKDGQSGPIPDYCELLGAGETPRYGYSRTRLADYAGVDWDRTLLWVKEQKAFVVVDRVVPKEKGRYQFRVLWHGIGAAQRTGDGMLLAQKGPSLRIQVAPGPSVSLSNDAELGASNWDGYPYADPVVRSMAATAAVDLEAGEPYLFASVLHGNPNGAAAVWNVRSLAGAGGAIIETDGHAELGIVLGPIHAWPSAAPLASDAQVIISDAGGLTLLGSSRTTLNGKVLHSTAQSTCTAIARAADELAPARLPLGSAKCSLAAGSDVPAHRVLWEQRLTGDKPAAASEAKDEALHITRLAAARLTVGASQPDLLVATKEGLLLALKPDGSRRWTVKLGTPINDVTAADLQRNGRDDIVVARQDHYVAVLDADGRERWKRAIQYYRKPPYVNLVRTGDIDGDGIPEVIAGGENWRFYAYKADGTPLWNYESVHPSRSCAVADLNGDGKAEIVCGTHYYTVTAVNGGGLKIWSYQHGPIAYDIATGSFDGNRTRGVVIGSGDGSVHYVGPDGKLRMVYNTGDEVKHVLAADIDGDGRDEIFAGSLSHYLYCFGPDGKRRWAVDLGAGVSALAAAQNGVVRAIVAGTSDGRIGTLDEQGSILARSQISGGVTGLLADGSTIVVAGSDGTLRRLSINSGD